MMKGETPPGSGIFLFSQFPPRGTGPILILSFFFCPTQLHGDSSCPFRSPRTSASVQYVFFENGSTNVFFGVDVFLMYLWQEMSAVSCYSINLITPLWIQVIIHLSKPTEHVIPRVNTNVNHGLQAVPLWCGC